MSLNFIQRTISCNDKSIQTYHLNENANKQLYFSHANGFNGLTYNSLLKNISKKYKVSIYDMRGHGDTTLNADPTKLKSWHLAELRKLTFVKLSYYTLKVLEVLEYSKKNRP